MSHRLNVSEYCDHGSFSKEFPFSGWVVGVVVDSFLWPISNDPRITACSQLKIIIIAPTKY